MSDKKQTIPKKRRVIKQQNFLSDNLVTKQIVTRLPVKSVVQLTSVSKQWYSTLSSSDFANAHLIKSPFSHPSAPVNSLFIKCGERCYLFSYDDNHISDSLDYSLVELDIDFRVEKEDSFRLAGCCNGLVCLTQSGKVSGKYFVVWNPATRKSHRYESDWYIERSEGINYYPSIVTGFGYSSSANDYKYVRILCMFQGFENPNCIIGVDVFCLKEKKWRKIDFDIQVYVLNGRAMLIGEKLYWAACCVGSINSIVSFDLGTEKFDVFSCPNSEHLSLGGMQLNLGSMGDCLCKFAYDTSSVDLLKPPTVVIKSISLPEGLNVNMSSEMIGYTRTGQFFMTGRFSQGRSTIWNTLLLVDPVAEPTQDTLLLKSKAPINIARFVPSLISPFLTCA